MKLLMLTKRKIVSALVVLIISILAQFFISPPAKKQELINKPSQNKNYYKVIRVIDGDTIELETGEKVRYIGADAPELHHPTKTIQCFAREAYMKNKELVEGKLVELKKDISETDRYKRLLRYVYLIDKNSTSEAIFINNYLVKNGFAYAATFPPDVRFSSLLIKSQEEARINQLGLWKSCPILH